MAKLPPNPDATLPPPPLRTLAAPLRWLLLAFAVLCLVLGVIGVFVPGLPTTVFILMAAWAAARSSPRLHQWLWFHPLFGGMLRDWAHGGCVARQMAGFRTDAAMRWRAVCHQHTLVDCGLGQHLHGLCLAMALAAA